MSDRMAMIRRLAETDPYWKGYVDGVNRVRDPEPNPAFAAYLDTSTELAQYETGSEDAVRLVREVRADLAAERRTHNWDADWEPVNTEHAPSTGQ